MEAQAVRFKDEMAGQILRAVVRQEVAAVLEELEGRGLRRDPVGVDREAGLTAGVDPYALVPFAERVLQEEGGPLHVRVLAERMYRLGFRHRRPPKYRDQLERSLNSLASPSQHPEIFERVGPRTLALRG
ncbi:MAG TPA: HTH domain-containing protein [Solirubrobacterales bacterium]|jgi:hypothetical protein|nr:HTH domain-containing protein [Solirubrobacterales bacterium]